MKNRIAKIITFILAALLILGSVIGIAVSAEEDARIEIMSKNISYEGAIKILYAVKVDTLADGEYVEMEFYATKDAETAEYTKKLSGEKVTFNAGEENEATFDIVFSNGIAPKNMRKTIYAKAFIKNADGVVASTELCEYSIWQYAINRFEKEYTNDQCALYTSMLNYGASVQKVLMEDGKYTEAELLACGGYANEYCGIKVNTVVDGEAVAEGTVKYYAPAADVALGAEKVYGESVFEAYFDANGDQVSVNGWNRATIPASTPGVSTYTATYITTGALPLTFDGDTIDPKYVANESYSPAVEETMTVEYTDTTDGKVYEIEIVISGKLSLDQENGLLHHERHHRILDVREKESGTSVDMTPDGKRVKGTLLTSYNYTNSAEYPEFGRIGYNTNFRFYNQTPKNQYGILKRHVFETDVLYSGNDSAQFYLRANTPNNQSQKIWGFSLTRSGNKLAIAMCGSDSQGYDHGLTIATLDTYTEWVNIRLEYYDLPDGQLAVYFYVNGELCRHDMPTESTRFPYDTYADRYYDGDAWVNPAVTNFTADDSYINNVFANFVNNATQMDLFYDNTYFATEYVDARGTGMYANDDDTLTYDVGATGSYSGQSTMNSALGFYTTNYNVNGNITDASYATIYNDKGDGYLINGTNSSFTSISTGWMTSTPLHGDTYIYETDLLWNGASAETVKDPSAALLRIYGVNSTTGSVIQDANGVTLISIRDSGASNSNYTIAISGGTTSANLPKGEWINLRLEVTPLSAKRVINKLYINGNLIDTKEQDVNKTATADATAYTGAYMYIRCADRDDRWRTNTYSYALDNTYLGAYRNASIGDTTLDGNSYTFEEGETTTFEVYNPETAPNGIFSGTPASIDNSKKSNSIKDGKLVYNPGSSWGGTSFAYKGNTTVADGDVLVFESNLSYTGSANPDNTDKRPAFIGFTSDGDNNSYSSAYRYANWTEDGKLEIFGVVLEPGVTYNIRIEHVVGESRIAYRYINGEFIDKISTEKIGASSDEYKFTGFFIYARPGRYSTTDPIVFTIEDVFVGVIRNNATAQ